MTVTLPDTAPPEETCPWCDGKGACKQLVQLSRKEADRVWGVGYAAHFTRERPCPRCEGRGRVRPGDPVPTAEDLKKWEDGS